MAERKTPLYGVHERLGARIVPFAGFLMPIQYDGILAEHARVRQAVGLFDVSHMGEVRVRGPRALEVVNRMITNDLGRVADGRAQYTAMCAEDGTIVDDLICYRLSPEEIFICVNAANRQTDFEHMTAVADGDAELTDEGDDWAQIAVQGPKAMALVGEALGSSYGEMKPFRIRVAEVAGTRAYVSTTGYTGERGVEIYVPSEAAQATWELLEQAGAGLGVGPAGLGARDTLRLEAAYCLYGNDIDRTTTPLEAGLSWVVRLDKPEFVGREALLRQKEQGVARKLVGLEVFDRGIARAGYPVLADGREVGRVTSGTKGPTVGKSIALAYVPAELSAVGTELAVDCRGRQKPARVVETPFYKA